MIGASAAWYCNWSHSNCCDLSNDPICMELRGIHIQLEGADLNKNMSDDGD